MAAQGDDIHEVVGCASRHLHEAAEALERPAQCHTAHQLCPERHLAPRNEFRGQTDRLVVW